MTDKPQLLVVDDSRVIRHAATKMLGGDYTVHQAKNGLEGWQQLQRNESISTVFVDMQMPEMSGMELLQAIRSADDDRLASLPVIMITGSDESEAAKKQVFEAGATDFIAKPFESIDLVSRAKSYAVLNRRVVELESQAGNDAITGLLNTTSFNEQGARVLSFALRHGMPLSLVCLEVIDFRILYRSHGKQVMQQILASIAKRMTEVMRTEDIAARTGTARFALLLPMTGKAEAPVVVKRVRESVRNLVFNTGREKLRIRFAAGLVTPKLEQSLAFSGILAQADAMLAGELGSRSGAGERGPANEPEKPVAADTTISEALVYEALQHVIEGNYSSIPPELLHPVAERLAPFFDYVNSQQELCVASANGTVER